MANYYRLKKEYRILTEEEKKAIRDEGLSPISRRLDITTETLRRAVSESKRLNIVVYNKIFNPGSKASGTE